MNQTSEPRILITGATGRHGGVGVHAVKVLREKGLPVRALVRVNDERAIALRELGAQTVIGDFMNIASLRDAMKGIDRVLFCYPIRDGLLEAAANMAVVARESDVKALLDLSLMVASDTSPSQEAREHWLKSEIFEWAGVNPIHLMGGFFYENLDFLAGLDMVERGVMEIPFGKGETKLAWVSGEDIARFSVAALLDPEEYIGKQHYVTGPAALTMNEVAEIASRVFGKPIRYDGNISINDWAKRLKTHPLANARLLQHAMVLAAAFGNAGKSFGEATKAVQETTGREPISFESHLESHLQRWK